MDKRICFIFASRERPEKFFKCLDNIQDNSMSENYFVWAKLDTDDPKADEYRKRIDEYPELTVKWGLSEGKIHAINRDLEDLPDFYILCNHSDDMVFTEFGFDDVIRQYCGLDDFVHFPDGYAEERVCTYSIFGKDYFKRFGYIYHPDYFSVYSDNEQTDVAKILGKHKFVNKRILRHEHPVAGYGKPDALLRRTEAAEFYQKDRQTYLRRKAINFDL